MGYFFSQRRWQQQPNGAVTADLTNPLFNSMSHLLNPAEPQAPATGNAIGFNNFGQTVSTSNIQTGGIVVPRIETQAGVCVTPFVGTSGSMQYVIPAADPNAQLPWTYFCVLTLSAVTNSTVCTIESGGGSSFDRELEVFNGTPNFRGHIFDGATQNLDGATKVVTGRQYNVVLSCTSSLLSLWVNGNLDGTKAVSNAGFNGFSGTTAFAIGGGGSFNASGPQIALLGRLNNYAWTQAEVSEWSKAPYQVWKRSPRRVIIQGPQAAQPFVPYTWWQDAAMQASILAQ